MSNMELTTLRDGLPPALLTAVQMWVDASPVPAAPGVVI
jgi:hypothetical protein